MGRFTALLSQYAFASVVLGLTFVAQACAQTSVSAAVPGATFALKTGTMLAVIGVSQEAQLRGPDRKSPEYSRIGFGLATLLSEVLFDTGKFRLMEEKALQKRELLDNLAQTYWIEPGPRYSAHRLQSIALQLGVELLAYGSIVRTKTSKFSSGIAFANYQKQKLQVKVNVCLYEASAGGIVCDEGQGEAQQEGAGVVYAFHGDRLDFENNAASKATKHAVILAVKALMTRIHFAP
jgi:curli biogenesis system outer membrane secretion channel CsgG